MRIFARVPGIGTEENAWTRVFQNISNKVFQQKILKTDPIFKYIDIIRDCILCAKKTKKICCNDCFKNRKGELDQKIADKLAVSEKEKRKCIDTCKKCLSQESDEIFCGNVYCPEYVPRKKSIVETTKILNNRKELEDLMNSGALSW